MVVYVGPSGMLNQGPTGAQEANLIQLCVPGATTQTRTPG